MNLIGQDQKAINERACKNLMTIQVNISTEYGLKPLIAAVKKLAKSTRIPAEHARLLRIIARLTPYQKPIDFVKSQQSLLRTYLYTHTMSLSQKQDGQQQKGERVTTVTEIPEIYNALRDLEFSANEAAKNLAPIWDGMREDILREVRDLEIDVSDILVSGVELSRRFITSVGTPKCIHSSKMSGMSLPSTMADKWAKESEQQLTTMLEGAKNQALKDGLTHMDLIVTQLSTGKRLSQSLIDHAQTHSKKMRGMVEAYDNDARVLFLCDEIDKHISNKTTDVWKDDSAMRQKSLEVANSVRKNLTAITAPVSQKQIDYANIQLAGGLLPDLID
tara:strand:+ start:112 stop:1110 length:999 start_codon:yes stop_codon:yes gene_type:complete